MNGFLRFLICCHLDEVYPAHVPYWDKVSTDPSFAEMRQVVHMEGERPPITEHWETSRILSRCARLMRECWHPTPEVRLPILRIKKTLDDVFQAAVQEIDDLGLAPETVVSTTITTPRPSQALYGADSGINSHNSHGAPFHYTLSSSNPSCLSATQSLNLRSPREVLALGRIVRCPSYPQSSFQSSITNISSSVQGGDSSMENNNAKALASSIKPRPC